MCKQKEERQTCGLDNLTMYEVMVRVIPVVRKCYLKVCWWWIAAPKPLGPIR